MALLQIPDFHLEALAKVVSQLEVRKPLTADEENRLYKAASNQASLSMLEEGGSWGQAMDFPENYQKTEEEFFSDLKSINENLLEQVRAFSHFVSAWFSKGSHPPPYYADRITTILRKAKRFDLEKGFLAAYFKHFWSPMGSAKDQKLGERAKKIDLNIPAIPSSSTWYRVEEREWAAELNIKNLSIDIGPPNQAIGSKVIVDYKFYCLQCGGKVLDVDDESDELARVQCKKCKTYFGVWGRINTWLSRIAKKYVQLHGL
jgi:hypothetical protein